MASLAVMCIALLTGCSSTAFQDPDVQLRRQIDELQQLILGLQKKSVVAEVEILRLREKVAELEAAGQRAAATPAPVPATPPRRPDTAQPVTSAPPPPPIETTDLEPEPSFARRSADQPTATSSAANAAPSRGPEAPGESELAEFDEEEAVAVPMAAQALYDRGFTEYHEGRYLEAEASLQQFLEGFPDSEWSDNALYWIGEARYARRDYRGALAAFRETVNRFPLGNKVPDALLKSGQSLEQLARAIVRSCGASPTPPRR